MSRFVTPAKVGLLVLIRLYTGGSVPDEARMAVLDFLTPFTTGSPGGVLDADLFSAPDAADAAAERWVQVAKAMSAMEAVSEFEKLLSRYISSSSAAVDSSSGPVDGSPSPNLWHAFVRSLWAIDSLHELHSLFQNLPDLLAKTGRELQELRDAGQPLPPEDAVLLHPRSPFAMFVRRCEAEFSRLKFGDTVQLWKDFIVYRQPTAPERRKPPQSPPPPPNSPTSSSDRAAAASSSNSSSSLDFDSVLVANQAQWGESTAAVAALTYGNLFDQDASRPFAVSTDDIEGLLEFQVENMQRMGVRVPLPLWHQYERLIRNVSLHPSLTHYISFLESWRAGDYAAALENLHQYFDYTMNDRDHQYYQYALLNLAILQADFGCYKEAMDAMLQAVLTARETKDHVCLTFALNWLFQFGRTHREFMAQLEADNLVVGSSSENLAHLRLKSGEYGMWTIALSSLLGEARLGLAGGDDVAVSLEFMARASHLMVQQGLEGMIGAHTQVTLAFWDRFGIGNLLTSCCEVFLHVHAQHTVFEDELKITCCLAAQLAGRGRYDDALARLDAFEGCEGLRGWRPNQRLQKSRALIRLRRVLHRGDHAVADALLHQLLQDRADPIDPEITTAALFMQVECLARKGHLDEAFTSACELAAQHADPESGDVAMRVRLMLMKADLFCRAGRPERGLTLALAAASAAWHARLLSLLWLAVGAVAKVLHSLGEFAAAEDLVDTVLPRAVEAGACYLVGTLMSTKASAQMGVAGREHAEAAEAAAAAPDKDSPDEEALREMRKLVRMARAFVTLDGAYRQFAAVEDFEMVREVHAKQNTIVRAAEACDARMAKYMKDETEMTETKKRLWEWWW